MLGREAVEKEIQSKKERLTIYLVKDASVRDDKIIDTSRTKPPVQLKIATGAATLYVKAAPQLTKPAWADFLTRDQNVPEDLFCGTRSEGAVLIVRHCAAIFVLTFGMGFHLVDIDLMERDFGLRVSLKSIAPDKLRSLDKASYELNLLNTRNQSPKDADIFDLHVDTEADLVYAITGASTESLFGDHVTGRDALTITPEVTMDNLPDILAKALVRYKERMPAQFSWIDDVSRVKDSDVLGILDLQLSDLLNAKPLPANVWLGEPEIVDWERQIGYSFDLRHRTAIHPTLQLSDLLSYMLEHGGSISVESLKRQNINIINSHYQFIGKWTAYRCLYAEISEEKTTYILRNGVWYTVSADFVDRIDRSLATIETESGALPVYEHASEGDYNASVSSTVPGWELMDKDNIRVGGSYDKIEFCDLVRNGRDLVHVKYYRSSATLSHLFAQGSVSAETFIKHEDFRVRLNEKLPSIIKLNDPGVRPAASKYTVVYAIATTKNIPAELPFFSKVTLKNAFSNLSALGFGVLLSKIDIDEVFLKTATYRPNKISEPAAKTAGKLGASKSNSAADFAV